MEQLGNTTSAAVGPFLPVRVVVAQRRPLDGEGVSRILERHSGFFIVAKICRVEQVAEHCRRHHPDLLVLDARFDDGQIFRVARDMLSFRQTRAVIFIDDEPSEMRLKRVYRSRKKGTGYFSRWATSEEIVAGVRLALQGKFACDPAFRIDPGGAAITDHSPHFILRSPFSELSTKQLKIAKHLAEGKTGPQCAALLGVSPRTVENHRSNIMKKLGLRRVTELTRLAMREGLVS